MAAGLGTRMRSATPKHLHPLLGRRMVDWVIELGRARGADPLVVVASPDTADDSRARRRGPGAAARYRRRGPLARAPRSGIRRAMCSSLSGDPPLLTAELLADLVATHRPSRRASDGPVLRAGGARTYGRIVRDARRQLARDRRGTGRDTGGARVRRSTPRSTSSRRPALARARPAQPHNAQGELYLTDTLGLLVEGRCGGRRARRAGPERRTASTRAPSWPTRRRVLRDRINDAHMLAGVTIVDPPTTWIERPSSSSPTRRSIRSPCFGAGRGSRRRRDRAARRRRRRPSVPARRVGRSVTFAPERCSRQGRRRARSWRSRTRASARARRCRTSPTSATPTSARIRTSQPPTSPRTSRHSPAAQEAHDDREQRQDRRRQCVHRPCDDRRRRMDCSRLSHHRGCARECARDRPRAPGEQGRGRGGKRDD